MADDDTRYSRVLKRPRAKRTVAPPVTPPATPRPRSRETTRPGVLARGTERPVARTPGPELTPVTTLRMFGDVEVVVELAERGRVALVLPGALRLEGNPEEAMALAGALQRAARAAR